MKMWSRNKLILFFIGCFVLGMLMGIFRVPEKGGEIAKQLLSIPSTLISGAPDSEIEVFGTDGRSYTVRLSAQSYLVADLEKGTIFKEKSPEKVFPIASVTKLMTAIISLENIPQNQIATVSKKAFSTYGDEGGLRTDEKIKIGDLLYPLLIESSNDASEVLAEHIGRPAFLDLMNNKARALGMTNTYFDDPTGLSEDNVSTARDLVILGEYVRTYHPEILARTKVATYSVKKVAGRRAHTWYNHNKFVRVADSSYKGGKNGYIPEALQTGVSFFDLPIKNKETGKAEKRPVIVVVLKSSDRYRDFSALASYVTGGIRVSRVPSEQASLVFVGDIMLDRGVEAVVNKSEGGNFNALFKNSYFIESATLAFANLEGPVSDKGYDLQNLYSFRMVPRVIDALKNAGFDAVSVANNHIGDWGRAAFEDTLTRLGTAGILAVGGGFNKDDARKVKVKDVNGLKIGYLGFTDVGPEWLAENDSLSVILLASNSEFEKIITEAAKEVDHLVVSFHYGNEYEAKANARQKSLSRKAIDAGARIVVGHHPHVVEEVERYKDGVIAYSLGNFIFDQNFSEETKQGLVLQVVLDGKKIAEVNQAIVRQDDHLIPRLAEDSDL